MLSVVTQGMKRMTLRGFVVLSLISGSFFLAVGDAKLRDNFTDMTKVGIGAYFGMLMPQTKREDGDTKKE